MCTDWQKHINFLSGSRGHARFMVSFTYAFRVLDCSYNVIFWIMFQHFLAQLQNVWKPLKGSFRCNIVAEENVWCSNCLCSVFSTPDDYWNETNLAYGLFIFTLLVTICCFIVSTNNTKPVLNQISPRMSWEMLKNVSWNDSSSLISHYNPVPHLCLNIKKEHSTIVDIK